MKTAVFVRAKPRRRRAPAAPPRPPERSGRLERIAHRQRAGRRRDLLFACFIALIVLIAVAGAAVHALGAPT